MNKDTVQELYYLASFENNILEVKPEYINLSNLQTLLEISYVLIQNMLNMEYETLNGFKDSFKDTRYYPRKGYNCSRWIGDLNFQIEEWNDTLAWYTPIHKKALVFSVRRWMSFSTSL
jgi:hypothetical protein